MNIVDIFPIKIAIIDDFECDQKIIDSLNNLKCIPPINHGVSNFSENTYIFDDSFYDALSEKIISAVNYYSQVLQLRYDKFQFTQSWVTECVPGLQHRHHSHTNSIISGVYYFDTDESSSPIVFCDNAHTSVRFNTLALEDEPDLFVVPSIKNRLVLFPSYLEHSVPVTSVGKRRSLAFNTLPLSKIGSERSFAEIRYDRLK